MTTFVPVQFTWTEELVMKPAYRFLKLCQKQFKFGESYMLEVRERRSSASHAHYFACVDDAWNNLSPDQTAKMRTPTHLRRWALIETGHFNEVIEDVGSHDTAVQVAKFARKITNNTDEYAEIVVRGTQVAYRTAKSQSVAAMDKTEFERSKADVLALLADTINVTKKELETQGKRSDVS